MLLIHVLYSAVWQNLAGPADVHQCMYGSGEGKTCPVYIVKWWRRNKFDPFYLGNTVAMKNNRPFRA